VPVVIAVLALDPAATENLKVAVFIDRTKLLFANAFAFRDTNALVPVRLLIQAQQAIVNGATLTGFSALKY
jgi:hypothetical protein